jgi:hypothetical protein
MSMRDRHQKNKNRNRGTGRGSVSASVSKVLVPALTTRSASFSALSAQIKYAI